MQFNVDIDTSKLNLGIEREIKRLGYNTQQALNNTGKDIQNAERINLDRKFTLRRTGFMYRLIKIVAFASIRDSRPYVEIAIDPTKQHVLLGKLETGGLKLPERGRNVAIPITGGPARPSFGSQVPTSMQVGNMHFKQHVTRTGKIQWKGTLGRYLIPNVGIFQRVGKAAARILYLFERTVHLKPVLNYYDVALKTALERWPINFRDAYKH